MTRTTSYRPVPARRSASALPFALLLALPIAVAAIAAPIAVAEDERGAPPKPDAPPKSPGSDERSAPTGNPDCVHVRTEARYIPYGYDHIVEVENTCDKAVSCSITTDVNPTSTQLSVPAKQTRSVTTFRGSPAREFKAEVSCKEQD